ncbi:MAG: cell division protein ZapA [Gammaproteobacteria bacterium]|jgi:cell division protein ZapA|nr:cell division protein ZapA [Gammaproteobacteria bacterium]
MSENAPVSVKVLQKEYKIACPPEQQESLIEAATLVDQKMREIQGQKRSSAQDRVAIMVAINIAYDLIQLQKEQQLGTTKISSHLNRLKERIDATLTKGMQLKLEQSIQ